MLIAGSSLPLSNTANGLDIAVPANMKQAQLPWFKEYLINMYCVSESLRRGLGCTTMPHRMYLDDDFGSLPALQMGQFTVIPDQWSYLVTRKAALPDKPYVKIGEWMVAEMPDDKERLIEIPRPSIYSTGNLLEAVIQAWVCTIQRDVAFTLGSGERTRAMEYEAVRGCLDELTRKYNVLFAGTKIERGDNMQPIGLWGTMYKMWHSQQKAGHWRIAFYPTARKTAESTVFPESFTLKGAITRLAELMARQKIAMIISSGEMVEDGHSRPLPL